MAVPLNCEENEADQASPESNVPHHYLSAVVRIELTIGVQNHLQVFLLGPLSRPTVHRSEVKFLFCPISLSPQLSSTSIST